MMGLGLLRSALLLCVIFAAYEQGHGAVVGSKADEGDALKLLDSIQSFINLHGPKVRADDGTEVMGDVLLTAKQAEYLKKKSLRINKRRATAYPSNYWPGSIVPFHIADSIKNISDTAINTIHQALDHWASATCLMFTPYNPALHGDNYIVFRKEAWCSSYIGMVRGAQYVNMISDCFSFGTIIHEVGHVVGWWHEHVRPDRDIYVTIDESKIEPGWEANYQKRTVEEVNTIGMAYDFRSIMHYPDKNGVITTVDPAAQKLLGQRNGLSFADKKFANIMYKCNAHCDAVSCVDPGYVDQNCECQCPDDAVCAGVDDGIVSFDPSANTTTAPPTTTTEQSNTTLPLGDPCYWTYAPSTQIMDLAHKASFQYLTLEQCKLKCLEDTTFFCRAFHYTPKSSGPSMCYLSPDKYVIGNLAEISETVYWQRPDCLAATFCGWEMVDGAQRSGSSSRAVPALSYNHCQLLCLQEKGFTCQSINYFPDHKSCFLFTTIGSSYTNNALSTYTVRLPCTQAEYRPVVACEAGWILFQGSCYLVPTEKKTWAQADNFCRIVGGYLMMSRTYVNEIAEMVEEGLIADISYWADNEHAELDSSFMHPGKNRINCELASADDPVEVTTTAPPVMMTTEAGQPLSDEALSREARSVRTRRTKQSKWERNNCHSLQKFICEQAPIGL